MALKLSRRSVYAGTIVAMLAMMGGLALAASPFGSIITSGQNGYSGTIGSTVWAGTVQVTAAAVQPVPATCSASGAAAAVTPSSAGQTVTLYYHGASAGTCALLDFYEEYIFNPTTPVAGTAGGQLDTFTLYSDVAGTLVSVPLTVTLSGTNTISHLEVFVDYTLAGVPNIPGTVGAIVQGA